MQGRSAFQSTIQTIGATRHQLALQPPALARTCTPRRSPSLDPTPPGRTRRAPDTVDGHRSDRLPKQPRHDHSACPQDQRVQDSAAITRAHSYRALMRVKLIIGALATALLLSGCTIAYRPGLGAQALHKQSIKIPPGMMPPPGECRIWFEGRPPGQEPPPGDCNELEHEVPPGAVLVHG